MGLWTLFFPTRSCHVIALIHLIVAAFLLSACYEPAPPRVPGQPLTFQQKWERDLQAQQEQHRRHRAARGTSSHRAT